MSFDMTVSGLVGSVDPTTVTIDVQPINDIPVAVDDVFLTDLDATLDIPLGDVMANDSNVDNDVLTVEVAMQPVNGTLTIVGDDDEETVNFSYTVDDNNGTTDVGFVTVNQAPISRLIFWWWLIKIMHNDGVVAAR